VSEMYSSSITVHQEFSQFLTVRCVLYAASAFQSLAFFIIKLIRHFLGLWVTSFPTILSGFYTCN
jgi:hypothetical protein